MRLGVLRGWCCGLRWLRIDPTFDPLRKHPRFVKLVEGT
jgi:hypothetical protein